MSAACWLCVSGLAGLSSRLPDNRPIAACSDCSALACQGHAEKARAAGKWFCLECVAVATAVRAGLMSSQAAAPELVAAVSRLELNFPDLSETTLAERLAWRDPDARSQILQRITADEALNDLDEPGLRLAADAVGIAKYLAEETPSNTQLETLLGSL